MKKRSVRKAIPTQRGADAEPGAKADEARAKRKLRCQPDTSLRSQSFFDKWFKVTRAVNDGEDLDFGRRRQVEHNVFAEAADDDGPDAWLGETPRSPDARLTSD